MKNEADLNEPAIYIANLSAYNAGTLKGAWINPATDKDELQAQIADAIGGRYELREVEGDNPAWAVFDNEEKKDAEGRDGPLRFDDEDEAREACRELELNYCEWAVHDYNLFPDLGEHPSLKDLVQVAELFDSYDHDAVRAAIANESNLDGAEDSLREGWREYDMPEDRALEDYAQELQDQGVLTPEFLLRYVDWERVGRDIRHDFNVVEHDGKTFIFFRV